MKILINLLGVAAAVLASATAVCAQAPTVDTLKQVLNQRLQKLRPDGSTERNVLFQEVRAGNASGGDYPFQVTALVRDYGPGYPANRFYGETCVGRMDKRVFRMSRDDFGQWQVQGAMTITHGPDLQCKPNPSAGVSSIPLSGLSRSTLPVALIDLFAAFVDDAGQFFSLFRSQRTRGARNDGHSFRAADRFQPVDVVRRAIQPIRWQHLQFLNYGFQFAHGYSKVTP
jgi:hypothetical protein